MTARELSRHAVVELPPRFALSLVDPSSFLSYANATQTAPVSQGTTSTDPLLGSAMGKLSDASAAAASSPAGATAQNVDSPGSTSFASVP